jgi:small subunit ribosomal protein S14
MARLALINKALKEPKFSTRKKNRCSVCGRARAYYRDFGVCRCCLRLYASRGQIPGMIKASW